MNKVAHHQSHSRTEKCLFVLRNLSHRGIFLQRIKKQTLLLMALVLTPLLSPAANLLPVEVGLLSEIKQKTIAMVVRQGQDARKMQSCFLGSQNCDPQIKKNLRKIRQTIRFKNEEYRILLSLASKSFFLSQRDYQQANAVNKLSLSSPRVVLGKVPHPPSRSEYAITVGLGREDLTAMENESAQFFSGIAASPYYDSVGERVKLHKKEASEFYKLQAVIAVQNVPFIVFLKSDNPTDREIAAAIGTYIQRSDEVANDLKDLKENPLLSFLTYQPVVNSVVKNSPEKRRLVLNMMNQQAHRIGIRGWVERNLPSIKMAAFTTCSFVGAVLQSWPVSISCGGAALYLTSRQLYADYLDMQDGFAMWLSGAQTFNNLQTSEAKVLYSTIAMVFIGQGIYSTVAGIEAGLVASINALPNTIVTRFSSLTALKEGGTRFVVTQSKNKGKDLGASIFAEETVDEVTLKRLRTREARIFTYKDLLNLREAVARH